MKKKISFLLLAATVGLISMAAVFYVNADFSGEWNLNKSKSDLGEWGERIAPKKMTVKGQGDAISIDRLTPGQNGDDVTYTEKLTFDGKEAESVVFGSSKKKSKVSWSDDKQTMTLNSVILFDNNGETMEIKVSEVWKLIDNGQAVSVVSTSSSSFGDNTMKLVYDKAK